MSDEITDIDRTIKTGVAEAMAAPTDSPEFRQAVSRVQQAAARRVQLTEPPQFKRIEAILGIKLG
ncbi:MAG: hypothetical protein AB7G06_02260 [Bdellovibrionales bacterium]